MQIAIRRALAEDGPGIARVRVLAWQAAYRGLLPDVILDSMDIRQEAEKWKGGLANLPAERLILIAQKESEQGAEVIAFCAAGPEREMDPQFSAEIYALYVLPNWQGQGTGRALLTGAGRWLRDQGHKQMIIYVLRDNHPARRFYEAVGGVAARERLWDIHGTKMPEVGYGYDLHHPDFARG